MFFLVEGPFQDHLVSHPRDVCVGIAPRGQKMIFPVGVVCPSLAFEDDRRSVPDRKLPRILLRRAVAVGAGDLHLMKRGGVDISVAVNVNGGVTVNALEALLQVNIGVDRDVVLRVEIRLRIAFPVKGRRLLVAYIVELDNSGVGCPDAFAPRVAVVALGCGYFEGDLMLHHMAAPVLGDRGIVSLVQGVIRVQDMTGGAPARSDVSPLAPPFFPYVAPGALLAVIVGERGFDRIVPYLQAFLE